MCELASSEELQARMQRDFGSNPNVAFGVCRNGRSLEQALAEAKRRTDMAGAISNPENSEKVASNG